MPISTRRCILAITLALTIIISSSVFPNTNNSFVVKALSKKDSLYPTSSSHNSDRFFYQMLDGHKNRCYSEYKLASIVCTKGDGASNDNSSTASSLGSSTYYLHNYSRITPSNGDVGKIGKNSDDNSNYNANNGNQNLQTSDSQDNHLSKLQQKIEKLQSRIDKLREQSRIRELENYGSKDYSPSSLSSLPPPVPTAMTNSTLENNTSNNSTLQSFTTHPPAAPSSSPAPSDRREHTIPTQDNGTKSPTTTNWVFNDDNSNRNNYTYNSGLDSSPLVLPVGNTHTTSTELSTLSSGRNVNSFSPPSRQIDTKDIADNAVTEAKLSRDAVHIVWDDNSPDSEILYRTNAGDVFARSADNLSHNAAVSFQPAIAVSGNNVYVVWSDNTPGRTDIFYTRSMDGGATFGGIINLSNTTGSSGSPTIAISANNVYVTWSDNTGTGEDGEILYRRSTDCGATFGSTFNLSNTAGDSGGSDIAVSGNNVYVAWSDNSEILYRRSTDGGATFGSTINLSNTAGVTRNPSVAVAGNNVYLVWHDNTSGNAEILLRKSVNAGATFGSTINISQNTGFSELPAIAVSPNNF